MQLAITGHRPNKLGNTLAATALAIGRAYEILMPEYVFEGQADGADLLAANTAWRLDIPYQAVLPFAGHRRMMKTPYWRGMWDGAREHADTVMTLDPSETYPGHWCMFNRNHYMVDEADEVLAIFDGEFGRGGTQETVRYAMKKDKPVHVIDPVTLELTTYAY